MVRDTGGVAYVEFLLSFIPIFFMFTGMIQGALLYTANLVVTHAANTAVRAAVVVLPDDPAMYDDEAVNSITGTTSKRRAHIAAAASIPLLAAAPSLDQVINDRVVLHAIGGSPTGRAANGALYNKAALAVSFPTGPGATTYRQTFGAHDNITVRVTYMFHCGVPLAARLMCDDPLSLIAGQPRAALEDLQAAVSSGDLDRIRAATTRVRLGQDRIERADPMLEEIDSFAEQPNLLRIGGLLSGARFVALQAEATMQNQGAPYSYNGDGYGSASSTSPLTAFVLFLTAGGGLGGGGIGGLF